MKESVSAGIAALVVVLCCALPILILSGVFVTGSGLLLNQQALLALGVLLVILAGLSWLALQKRSR
jgi:hypothetical protein